MVRRQDPTLDGLKFCTFANGWWLLVGGFLLVSCCWWLILMDLGPWSRNSFFPKKRKGSTTNQEHCSTECHEFYQGVIPQFLLNDQMRTQKQKKTIRRS